MTGWREIRTGIREGAARTRAVARWFAGGVADNKTRRRLASGLRRRAVANALPIVLSVAAASVIYMKIHERPNEEFVRNLAVRVRGAPEGSLIGIRPPTVRVTFRGKRNDLVGLDLAPPVIYVSHSRARLLKDGTTREATIRKRDVIPSGQRGFGTATVVNIDPKSVDILEDKTESRGFDIESPKLEGSPHRGYRAEVVDYSPKRVVVTGGRSRLQAWEELGLKLPLSPVSVDGRVADFSGTAKVLPPKGEDAMNVTIPDTSVQVSVRIVRPRDSSTIDDVPIRLAFPQGFSFPETVEVEPKSVTMTLVGVKEQLNEVNAADVAVYAEVATNALPISKDGVTNALAVALVARIPHDKSISEVNIHPPEAWLVAAGAVKEEKEEKEAGTDEDGTTAADATSSSPAPEVPPVQEDPSVPEESVEP